MAQSLRDIDRRFAKDTNGRFTLRRRVGLPRAVGSPVHVGGPLPHPVGILRQRRRQPLLLAGVVPRDGVVEAGVVGGVGGTVEWVVVVLLGNLRHTLWIVADPPR